jgi:hypothetical protein
MFTEQFLFSNTQTSIKIILTLTFSTSIDIIMVILTFDYDRTPKYLNAMDYRRIIK